MKHYGAISEWIGWDGSSGGVNFSLEHLTMLKSVTYSETDLLDVFVP